MALPVDYRPGPARTCPSLPTATPDDVDSPPRSRAGPAPARTGSATRPRAATPAPCPGCGTPPPGRGDDAGHRPPSGPHPMGPAEWTPLMCADDDGRRRGAHRDVRHRTRCAAPPDDARQSRAPGAPHRTGVPAATPCRGCSPLTRAVSAGDQVAVKGVCDRGARPAAARAWCGAAMPMECTTMVGAVQRATVTRAPIRTAPPTSRCALTRWSGAPEANRPVRGGHRGPGPPRRPPAGAGHRRHLRGPR